jgi:hypothetical protein
MRLQCLILPVLLFAVLFAVLFAGISQAHAQTCANPPKANPLGARIAQAALREYQEFNGHRINADGYLWKSGAVESETELLLDPETGQADASRAGRFAWRRVWEYWLTLQRHAPGEAMGRKIVSVPGLLENPRAAGQATQIRLRELFPRFRTDDAAADAALQQAAVRAALNDSPWSGAFISYLMNGAGMTAQQFRYSSAHWQYIQAAFEQPAGYAYRACDPRRTVPRVGDLLCHSRAGSALKDFAQWRQASGRLDFSAPSHCEVVIEVDTGAKKMELIGGNVLQSVTRRKLKLNAGNRLSESYNPERFNKARNKDCSADKTCEQPNLNMQYWGVILQLQ